MERIETIGEYKKALKTFVKGAIKSKLFVSDDKMNFAYTMTYDKKAKEGVIKMFVQAPLYVANFDVAVSTRVYNKVNAEFFEPIVAQFEKLKNFNGLQFSQVVLDGVEE